MSWKRNVLVVAAAIGCVGVVFAVRELQRVPQRPPGASSTAPLTDLAGPPRPVGALPSVAPAPLAVPASGAPTFAPSEMPDPQNPPQGTPALALPGDPVPPDPFQPPPIKQDPDRGREKK